LFACAFARGLDFSLSSFEELNQRIEVLERELSEARAQQAATTDILKVISRSAFDLDAVLTTLINSGTELCDAARGAIWLKRDDRLFLAAQVGYAAEWVETARSNPIIPAPDSQTTAGLAAFTGEIVHVGDIPGDPRFRSFFGHSHGDYRTILALPLKGDVHVVGVITLSRPEARLFTDRQVALVQTFADQAVIAIENARLFDEVKERTRDLSEALKQQTATADVLKVISRSAFDLGSVLQILIESAAALCDANTSGLYMLDGDVYRLSASIGASEQFVAYERAHPSPVGRDTFVGRTALEKTNVHVSDV
jgi:GAF domain-containing protein